MLLVCLSQPRDAHRPWSLSWDDPRPHPPGHLFRISIDLLASVLTTSSAAALLVSSSYPSAACGKVVYNCSPSGSRSPGTFPQMYQGGVLDNVWLSLFHHWETEFILVLLPRFLIRKGQPRIWRTDSYFLTYLKQKYGKHDWYRIWSSREVVKENVNDGPWMHFFFLRGGRRTQRKLPLRGTSLVVAKHFLGVINLSSVLGQVQLDPSSQFSDLRLAPSSSSAVRMDPWLSRKE